MGSVLFASYRYSEALERFKNATENWNLDDQYADTLANVYARLSICHAYLGQMDLAQSALNRATEKGVWDPDIAFAQCLLLFHRDGMASALEYIDQNIKEQPRLHTLYFGKALLTEYFLHNTSAAINWYIKALNKVNSFQVGREYRKHYLSTGGYAIPWYMLKSTVRAFVRTNKIWHAYLIVVLTKLLIWDSGVDFRIFVTYINILRGSLTSAENTCRIMMGKKLSAFSKVEYLSLLAQVQSKQGKADEAISSMQQALSLNSDELENWVALGSFQLQKMDWASAIATYQKVLQMNPFDFRSMERLGTCYRQIEDFVAARETYEKSLRLNPSEAAVWVDLADVYLRLGRNELAASAYQKALEYDWLESKMREHAVLKLKQMNPI
jgi:tetratricopeptide (TPR) repeat protein